MARLGKLILVGIDRVKVKVQIALLVVVVAAGRRVHCAEYFYGRVSSNWPLPVAARPSLRPAGPVQVVSRLLFNWFSLLIVGFARLASQVAQMRRSRRSQRRFQLKLREMRIAGSAIGVHVDAIGRPLVAGLLWSQHNRTKVTQIDFFQFGERGGSFWRYQTD